MKKNIYLLLVVLSTLFIFSPATAQNTCATAQTVTLLPNYTPALTTCGTGNEYDQFDACGNAYANGEDYIFKFKPTTPLDACISVGAAAAGTSTWTNRAVFVFDGCPDLATTKCIAQAGDVMGSAFIDQVQLTVGNTYFIMVDSRWGCLGFDFYLDRAVCTPPSVGDKCSNAEVVSTLPFAQIGETTCTSKSDYNEGNGCQSTYLNGSDYVYTYTPSANQCIKVSLPNAGRYTGLFVYNGCPDDPKSVCLKSSNSTTAALPPIPYISLTAGRKYYFVVSSNADQSPCVSYDINIDTVPCMGPGSTCNNPVIIPALPYTKTALKTCGFGADYTSTMACKSWNMGSEDYVMKYTATSNECVSITLSKFTSGGLFIMDGCPDDGATNCIAQGSGNWSTGKASVVTTLTAGKTYYIIVSNSWGCDADFDIAITTTPAGGAGSTCANPHKITSMPFTANNLTTGCFGNEYNSTNKCASSYMNGEDYVFEYTAAAAEKLSINLTGTTGYTGLFIVKGCPDDPASICIDKVTPLWGAANPNICTVSLPSAGTYYIIVDTDPAGGGWSPGPSFTPFNINITKAGVGPTCADPHVVGSLPYNKTGLTTKCMGNEYTSAMGCRSTSDNGNDVVFKYVVSATTCIEVNSKMSRNGGLALLNGCPSDPATTCIAQVSCNSWSGCPKISLNASLSPGTYYIVASSNSTWSDIDFDLEIKDALAGGLPTAALLSDKVLVCAGDFVKFSDKSTPCVDSWSWSFPGGTPSTSTSCCPNVTYNTPGVYDVILTSCNPAGCTTITKSMYIKVK